jgi:hypothetical protein
MINSISFVSITMSDEMVDELISALNHNSSITRLTFQDNQLSRISIKKLFNLLLSNPKLVSFDMGMNSVDDDLIQAFCKSFSISPRTATPSLSLFGITISRRLTLAILPLL